ncbi:hypothetical protein HGRIS_014730 [Hohenbuehelia grisea]|uniref:Uncharacterized protein n=1 Tax=Hohenbuehelia grisea TaxID=104357 RepID=A0ABR3IQM1_9AGAR
MFNDLAYLYSKGKAIYVYSILSNRVEPDSTGTKFNEQSRYFFTLDGNPETPFVHQPNGSNLFEYHSLVFAKADLKDGLHALVLRNGELGGDRSVMRLEQLVYDTNPAVTPISTPAPTVEKNPAIAAACRLLHIRGYGICEDY